MRAHYLQLLSRSSRVSFGGPGRFKITSWASCDLFTITSLSFTAVCMRRTLPSSLWMKKWNTNMSSILWNRSKRFTDVMRLWKYVNITYGLILGLDFSSLSAVFPFSFFASGDRFSSSWLSTCGLFGDEWLLWELSAELSFSSASSFSELSSVFSASFWVTFFYLACVYKTTK